MTMTPGPANVHRRAVLAAAASVAGAAALAALPAMAAARSVRFDRSAYDRYVALMNAADIRFAEYYAADIKYVMNIRGKADVLSFYERHKPYVHESLKVLFFCSDAHGAAAQVHSEMRCLKDCDDAAIFGRALKAGEVQRTLGSLFYTLNAQGQIAEIQGPPPQILDAWHLEG